MSSSIGFIGLGIMGKGMVKNLINKLTEATFVVYNRSIEASEELKSLYPERVVVASSAKEVVERCETTYCMLSTLDASKALFDGEDGVVAGVSAGKVIVDCATLTPERMIDEGERITAAGGLFLEAPVSGSKVPAETGQLIFLCGGDQALFDRVRPALDCMGKAAFLFGPVGQGSRMKLVVNMVMGVMMGALGEGVALCEAADLPADQLLQVLDLGAMACPLFKGKGGAVLSRQYPTNFPLKHAQKDLGFVLALGQAVGRGLPIAEATNGVYLAAMEAEGAGDLDFAAVAEGSRVQPAPTEGP